MTTPHHPFREPLQNTLLRTVILALAVGLVLTRWWGGLRSWPITSLLAFWFTFGGHWVELAFRNRLRPRLNAPAIVLTAYRIGFWFVGGCLLGAGAILTATLLGGWKPAAQPAWWLGGVVLVVLELIVHIALQLRRKPNAFNGLG